MTHQDRELIIRLWNNRMSINKIVRMLPYSPTVARQYVKEVKASGALKAENRVPNDRELVVQAYKGGMTNHYEIAETYGINYDCIRVYLNGANIHRQRPPHNYKQRKRLKVQELPEKTQQIITALKDGTPNAEVARNHGISRQFVWKVKKKYVDIGD